MLEEQLSGARDDVFIYQLQGSIFRLAAHLAERNAAKSKEKVENLTRQLRNLDVDQARPKLPREIFDYIISLTHSERKKSIPGLIKKASNHGAIENWLSHTFRPSTRLLAVVSDTLPLNVIEAALSFPGIDLEVHSAYNWNSQQMNTLIQHPHRWKRLYFSAGNYHLAATFLLGCASALSYIESMTLLVDWDATISLRRVEFTQKLDALHVGLKGKELRLKTATVSIELFRQIYDRGLFSAITHLSLKVRRNVFLNVLYDAVSALVNLPRLVSLTLICHGGIGPPDPNANYSVTPMNHKSLKTLCLENLNYNSTKKTLNLFKNCMIQKVSISSTYLETWDADDIIPMLHSSCSTSAITSFTYNGVSSLPFMYQSCSDCLSKTIAVS